MIELQIRVDHYFHTLPDDQTAQDIADLKQITAQQGASMTTQFDHLNTEVAETKAKMTEIVDFVKGQNVKLADLAEQIRLLKINADDPAALEALAKQLDDIQKQADAVLPAPPPPPVTP